MHSAIDKLVFNLYPVIYLAFERHLWLFQCTVGFQYHIFHPLLEMLLSYLNFLNCLISEIRQFKNKIQKNV